MKLLAKFNLIFLLVFGLGLTVAGWIAYRFMERIAREHVSQQAKLMMETTLGTRDYTTVQLKPLLQFAQLHQSKFLPQTVPAYAATEAFSWIHNRYPAYTYKEATLNPTNLRDRAVDWEADIVNSFRNDRQKQTIGGERDTPEGRSMYLARPIVAKAACLECHSTPDRAPQTMLTDYGSSNGFGWKENEVIGAQIVSVPMSVPLDQAHQAFTALMISLGVVALATLIVLDLALVFVVIRPVSELSRMADQISQGNLDVEELPVHGKDEIATLSGAFNRMYLSLRKAMKMLEE